MEEVSFSSWATLFHLIFHFDSLLLVQLEAQCLWEVLDSVKWRRRMKDGIVVISDACIADALSIALGTFLAGVDADLPKMFPTATELQLVTAPPPFVLLPLQYFSKVSSTSIASSL